jgi:hypothetical protein
VSFKKVDELYFIVDKALEKEAEKRYQMAGHMVLKNSNKKDRRDIR